MARACRPRDWRSLVRRHRAFWNCDETDRPLIGVTCNYFVDTEFLAGVLGDGELQPHAVDPRPILGKYDKVAAARDSICDDIIAVGEPLYGIPWLEAICGCRVMVSSGKSIWPEPPEDSTQIGNILWSTDNPWFQRLLEVTQAVVNHAGGRYAAGISHLRGPSDVLVALLGTERFFLSFFDAPELIGRMARQCARVWREVARAESKIIPSYRDGYALRFYGLWAPAWAVWLQDDTSVMMSLSHYRQFFLDPVCTMSGFPYGTFHLHIPSLHIAETVADVPNVRAINLTFDSPAITLQRAMPTMQRLQARRMPLILTKDAYEGFTWAEYDEILDGLSPRGLCVHLRADSVEDGQAVMAHVRERSA